MEEYWPKRFGVKHGSSAGESSTLSAGSEEATAQGTAAATDDEDEDDFDRSRKERFDAAVGGWMAELKRYREDPCPGVTKDTDTIAWWHVR